MLAMQADLIERLLSDNIQLAQMLQQQSALRQQYADHLFQQEHFPPLTSNLN